VKSRPQSSLLVSRRDALRLLSAAGLAPFAVGAGALSGCGGDAPNRVDGFALLLSEPDDMARIGQLWIESQTAVPGIADLLEALGWPAERAASPASLRRWLRRRQRDDWLADRVYAVQGFRLAHTEVHLYALAAWLNERDLLPGAD
jgi:hypothetical protein